MTILIRCSFRVAELSEGFKGTLANNEVLFIIFEGVMMVICVFVLTVGHPGLTLGAHWNRGAFSWRSRRDPETESNIHYQQGSAVTGAEAERIDLSRKGSSDHSERNNEKSAVREVGGVA